MHLLLFLQASVKFDTPNRVDEVICTKLLDPSWDPTGELLGLVTGNMFPRSVWRGLLTGPMYSP
jgi:hypothetical protein